MSAETIKERDKPFFLLLIALTALILLSAYGVLSGRWNDAAEAIKILSSLVLMGWGLYFKKSI